MRGWYDTFMNLNEQRLGAYNRILHKDSAKEAKDAGTAGIGRSPRASGSTGAQATPVDEASKKRKPAGAGPSSQTPRGTSDAASALPGLIKVPSASGGKESPYRKVAKFLLLIGVDEAAKVMAKLTEAQTEKVVLELASIRRVDKDEAAIVLAEFESLLAQAREPEGGVATARSILEAAFGSERADAMLKRAVPNFAGKPFDYLDGIEPDRLARIIEDELPAVKALVLSQLKPKLAADVIRGMGDAEKSEVVLRLAKLKAIDPEVLRRVDDAIREKVESVRAPSSDSIDGRSALASILKHMDVSSEKSILVGLSDSDPDLGKDLRERLFTIDDVVNASDKFLQETLRGLSDHDLAALIAGKDDTFRDKILSNVSRSRGAIVLEEESVISPVTRAESERVTGAFFSTMRRAWENGEFFIAGRDAKEVWV